MLNVLLSCFLSFAVLGSSTGVNFVDSHALSPQSDASQLNISYDALKVAEWRNWGIGNHRMVQVNTCEFKKVEPLELLTPYYSSIALEDFTFSETITTIFTTSLSLTVQEDSYIASGLNVQAGIPGATVTGNLSLNKKYTFESTVTYTSSTETTFKVEYKVAPEMLDGRHFALCIAAEIYEITYDTWIVEDWWWGQYESAGSRRTEKAYISYNPYVTIAYQDGEVVL